MTKSLRKKRKLERILKKYSKHKLNFISSLKKLQKLKKLKSYRILQPLYEKGFQVVIKIYKSISLESNEKSGKK